MKKPKATWVNKYALIQKKIEVDLVISKVVAKAYLENQGKGQIPGWVEQMTDLESMELAAIDG